MDKIVDNVVLVMGKAGWYFRLRARNGKTLSHSESYSSYRKAYRTAAAIADQLDIPLLLYRPNFLGGKQRYCHAPETLSKPLQYLCGRYPREPRQLLHR